MQIDAIYRQKIGIKSVLGLELSRMVCACKVLRSHVVFEELRELLLCWQVLAAKGRLKRLPGPVAVKRHCKAIEMLRSGQVVTRFERCVPTALSEKRKRKHS
ncbi:MAG: hypothetical protein KDA90_16825 [Planctomycetaceae bacterium]|nr:hypothetical protein [Planctomycetaceae bacterium]